MIDLDAIKARLARVVGKWPTKGAIAPGAGEFGPKAWAAHGPLRCHATEQGSARGWTQANADADFITAAPADIAALLAEIERLRAEVDLLRTGREAARCYADRVEAEVLVLRGERAAVVAWLHHAADTRYYDCCCGPVAACADAIERGEHRCEGE